MLCCVLRRSRSVALLGALLIVGCVAQAPQRGPLPATPSAPPPGAEPAPESYGGSYLDRLEAAARDALADSPVNVQRDGESIKLIVPANMAFAIHSAQLQPRFFPVLDKIAHLCRDYDKTAIAVKGFTDSTGSFEHNQRLSEQRAQNVGAYLSRDVAAVRIRTAGYGPRYPIADNRTDAGRLQNRRVEIDMAPMP